MDSHRYSVNRHKIYLAARMIRAVEDIDAVINPGIRMWEHAATALPMSRLAEAAREFRRIAAEVLPELHPDRKRPYP